ncbi:MAG: outer membrane lipoprotein carrier protein LolA [Myxococcota bacterium]|nr:outer membrane lipoprotein carrier protein LolA [Myxococcota bacterium]
MPPQTNRFRAIGWTTIVGILILTGEPSRGDNPLAAPPSLPALMEELAESGAVRAAFEESRTIALLVEPIETTGQLYFLPPHRLARITSWPAPSTVIVDGSQVILEDGLGRRSLNLNASPVGQSLIGGIAVLLGGDLEGLTQRYKTTYEVQAQTWSLALIPINPTLRSMIREIRVEGQGREIGQIRTFETNGDVTTTRLLDIETGVPLAEIEQAAFSSAKGRSTQP